MEGRDALAGCLCVQASSDEEGGAEQDVDRLLQRMRAELQARLGVDGSCGVGGGERVGYRKGPACAPCGIEPCTAALQAPHILPLHTSTPCCRADGARGDRHDPRRHGPAGLKRHSGSG